MILAVTICACAIEPSADNPFVADLAEKFAAPESEYRPEVRWWLAAGYHTNEMLTKNIQELFDSGFGAAEFIARGNPKPESIYSWGSEEWTNDARLIIRETTNRRMGFSITSGTNWGTANLPDTYTWNDEPYNYDSIAASKELNFETVILDAGERFNDALPAPELPERVANAKAIVLQGVVAAKLHTPMEREGSGAGGPFGGGPTVTPGRLDPESIQDLTDRVIENAGDYTIDWTAPDDGEYALFVFWMHGTGHTAEPSVSTNYTINYVDKYGVEALIDYWENVILTPELRETIRENGRGEIYMDSLEQSGFADGGVFWGYDFKSTFEKRRGYDVTPYMPFIVRTSTHGGAGQIPVYYYEVPEGDGEYGDLISRVRNDIYQTLSEMYVENVLQPLQSWLHTLNMSLRAEPSYGQLLEISQPAAGLDDVETESLAFSTSPDLYRGLLGGAHVYGSLFSSETGAVNGGNYRLGLGYWTQVSYLQFAAGVQRTVFHGYAGIEGPEDINWPGHEGMNDGISTRFNSRQPAHRHFRDLTTMLARNQKVLRQGIPRVDLAVLRTDYDYPSYGTAFTKRERLENSELMEDQAALWKDLSLQGAGYTYEYFAPMILEDEENVSCDNGIIQPEGPGYQAIVLYQERLPVSSARKILEMAQDGLPVVFVNNVTESVKTAAPLTHGEAASRGLFKEDNETQLRSIVGRIKALPNVRTVDDQADTLAALQALGVFPRVLFDEQNQSILTVLRQDDVNQVAYLYAYNYKFAVNTEPFTFEVTIDAAGKPYTLDDWTGEISEIGVYEVKDGKTRIPLTLEPGEATIVAIDLSDTGHGTHAVSTNAEAIVKTDSGWAVRSTESGNYRTVMNDDRTIMTRVDVPSPVHLRVWDLTVEDWNAGSRRTILEKQFGHTTTEYYYDTVKTRLAFPGTTLMPWKDLPATAAQLAQLDNPEGSSMADVSGLGFYETSFEWDGEASGAYLKIGSTNGNSIAVYVNGTKAPAIDLRTLAVDISDLLVEGTNALKIEVSSTLANRMRTKDYWDQAWAEDFFNALGYPDVQDYGMTGEVSIVPYVIAPLE